ncbi:MAG TPA: hypothetical protein VFM49_15735 [Chloroflexia bacterium]|jgi:hypothetical protein|nr:hypothetical protein [Chloroflexia bacterium]
MPPRRRAVRPVSGPPAAKEAAAATPPNRPRSTGYIVRASELGSYSYCRRAWWLRYVAGLEPPEAARARLEGGHLRHAEHGRGLWLAGVLWKLGVVCLVLAGVLALFWLLTGLLTH